MFDRRRRGGGGGRKGSELGENRDLGGCQRSEEFDCTGGANELEPEDATGKVCLLASMLLAAIDK